MKKKFLVTTVLIAVIAATVGIVNIAAAAIPHANQVKKVAASSASVSLANDNASFLSSSPASSALSSIPASPAALSLSSNALILYVGHYVTVGSSVPCSWSIDNTSVATIDENGKITALHSGSATVTASANGQSEKLSLTVKSADVSSNTSSNPSRNSTSTGSVVKPATSTVPSAAAKPATSISDLISNYKTQNPSTVGFLVVDGVPISTPVVQTTDNSYYLYHSFSGASSSQGTPFMDFRDSASMASRNTIIYGHNRSNGVMFANLMKFKDAGFLRLHNVIHYHAANGSGGDYQIFSAFTVAGNAAGTGYQECRYITTDFSSDSDFLSFVQEMQSWSYVNLGVNVSASDHILTLSTCDPAAANGRFAIMAKKIS